MKVLNQIKILGLFLALLFLEIFQPFNVSAQNEMDAELMPLLTNAPPPGFATRLDYLKSFTNEDDIIHAYRNRMISKGEAFVAHFFFENAKQQDFYGKVVDQNGQPVVGANVMGYLRFEGSFGVGAEKAEVFKTQTDAEGLFQFTGLHGARFGQKVSKDGYEMSDEAYVEQTGPRTSPNDRATFMMWKLRGAESMTHIEFTSRIPYDGTPAEFDLTTGIKATNGDFKITLSRSPLKIRRGRDKYNWTVKIEIATGELMRENDPYPYWAPDTGYKSFFQTSMSSNEIPWSAELRQNFYFRSSQDVYGHLFIDLSTDSMRPDTGITIQTWVNPSGSRNLEFDPKKQIR